MGVTKKFFKIDHPKFGLVKDIGYVTESEVDYQVVQVVPNEKGELERKVLKSETRTSVYRRYPRGGVEITEKEFDSIKEEHPRLERSQQAVAAAVERSEIRERLKAAAKLEKK